MKPLLNLLRSARHVAAVLPLTAANEPYFRPKHCAGGNHCLHEHPDDSRCDCGQVILPRGVEAEHLEVIPAMQSKGFVPARVRHSADGCHAVTPASAALQKAGA